MAKRGDGTEEDQKNMQKVIYEILSGDTKKEAMKGFVKRGGSEKEKKKSLEQFKKLLKMECDKLKKSLFKFSWADLIPNSEDKIESLNYWMVVHKERDYSMHCEAYRTTTYHCVSTFNLIKGKECKKNKNNCSIIHKRDAFNGTIDCWNCTTISSMWIHDHQISNLHISQCFTCQQYFCTPDIERLLKRCTKCKKKYVCKNCESRCTSIVTCKECCKCKSCHPPKKEKNVHTCRGNLYIQLNDVTPISKEEFDRLNLDPIKRL